MGRKWVDGEREGKIWGEALGRKWENGYRYPSFQNLIFFFFLNIKSGKAFST
jgi:hypothetical protein